VSASDAGLPDAADVAAHMPRFRGRALTTLISFIAGTGFTLFGCVFPAHIFKVEVYYSIQLRPGRHVCPPDCRAMGEGLPADS
jgi:hypothetical protein